MPLHVSLAALQRKDESGMGLLDARLVTVIDAFCFCNAQI